MINNNSTIQNILTDWGRTQKQVPQNNLALKSVVMNRFIEIGIKPDKASASFNMPWLSFAFASLAIVLFVVNQSWQFGATVLTNSKTQVGSGLSSVQTLQMPTEEKLKQDISSPQVLTPPNSAKNFQRQSDLSQNQALGDFKSINGQAPAVGYAQNQNDSLIYPQPSPEIPVADSREFLKTAYSANVLTRHIQESVQHIQTLVRGFGGRIDAQNNSESFGNLVFVIPADHFEGFRQELKSLFGERFIKENVSAENLLPQKQEVETRTQNVQNALGQLNVTQTQIINDHNSALTALNSQLYAANKELAILTAEVPQNIWRENEIYLRKQELQNQKKNLQAQIANENTKYTENINSINAQIQNQSANLNQLATQDQNLVSTVATVRGSITLDFVSFWELATLYIPGYWISILLIIAAVITYLVRRRPIVVIPN